MQPWCTALWEMSSALSLDSQLAVEPFQQNNTVWFSDVLIPKDPYISSCHGEKQAFNQRHVLMRRESALMSEASDTEKLNRSKKRYI